MIDKINKNLKKCIFIIILFVLCTPSVIFADCFGISGGAGGGGQGDDTSLPGDYCATHTCGCTSTCLWSFSKIHGVRIQIYKYDGSGNPQLVGKGVDIWATDKLYNGSNTNLFHFSSPSTPNLNQKARCKDDNPSATSFTSTYSLTAQQYFSGDYGKILVDSRFADLSNINGNVLTNDYTSGWIYDYVLKAFIDNGKGEADASAVSTFKDYFNFSDAQYNDLIENKDNYYISAEMLYRFYISGEASSRYINAGAQREHLYYGTASESAYYHGDDEVYRALWSNYGTVGQIASRSSSSILWDRTDESGKIHPDLSIGKSKTNEYNLDSSPNHTNRYASCNSMYGYAIWGFTACEKCTLLSGSGKTCSLNCMKYKIGTKEHTECAKNYCSDIPEGSKEEGQTLSECMNTCDTCENVCEKSSDKKACATEWCSAYDPDNKDCIKTCNKPDKTCKEECSSISNSDEKKTCATEWCSEYDGDNLDKCVDDCTQPLTCEEACKNDNDKRTCASKWCSENVEPGQQQTCISDCTKDETCEDVCKNEKDQKSCAQKWCSANEPNDQDNCVKSCAAPTSTCQEDCSGKTGAALESCAKDWCSKNSNDADCVKQCTPPEILYWDDTKSEGCQEEFKDTCSGYILDDQIYATSKQFTCSSSLENPNYSLSSRICEDDEGEFGTDLPNIYYKVECQEDLNLSGLPTNKLNIHFSVSGSASMYLGYNLDYTKTCKLWYKKAASSTTPTVTANTSSLPTAWFNKTEVEWTQSYSGTQAQYDLEKVKALKEEIKSRIDSMKDWGVTADSSVSVTSLAVAITEINKLEVQNVRNTYEGYLYPTDKPADRTRLACNDWYQYTYTCEWSEDCNPYLCDPYPCSNCNIFGCWPDTCYASICYQSCSEQSSDDFYDYQEPSKPAGTPSYATCTRGTSIASDKSNDCYDVEDKVEKLLAYYNLAIERLEKMQEYLEKVEEKGKNHLDLVKAVDQKNGTVLAEHQVSIDLVTDYSKQSTTKTTITLVPISCITEEEEEKRLCEAVKAICDAESGGENYTIKEDRVYCNDAEPKTIDETNTTTVYSYTISYGLPSSYLMTLSEKANKVYHDKDSCERELTGAGKCVEEKNVWVFDPVEKTAQIEALTRIDTMGEINVSMSGIGMCPFSAKLNCSYRFSTYKECAAGCNGDLDCLNKECGCKAYCGSNETCMFMYCPEECEKCGDKQYLDNPCDDECDECLPNCENFKSDTQKYTQCRYDCCSSKCMPGDQECPYRCCRDECKERYTIGTPEYEACSTGCDSGGPDYIFRPVDMNKPFPDRNPGANWSGKVEYITKTNDPSNQYYDKTDGRTNDFEYQIVLKSGDITRIKNDYSGENQTTYKDYERTNKKIEKYCSDFLHNYLNDELEDNSGSGC